MMMTIATWFSAMNPGKSIVLFLLIVAIQKPLIECRPLSLESIFSCPLIQEFEKNWNGEVSQQSQQSDSFVPCGSSSCPLASSNCLDDNKCHPCSNICGDRLSTMCVLNCPVYLITTTVRKLVSTCLDDPKGSSDLNTLRSTLAAALPLPCLNSLPQEDAFSGYCSQTFGNIPFGYVSCLEVNARSDISLKQRCFHWSIYQAAEKATQVGLTTETKTLLSQNVSVTTASVTTRPQSPSSESDKMNETTKNVLLAVLLPTLLPAMIGAIVFLMLYHQCPAFRNQISSYRVIRSLINWYYKVVGPCTGEKQRQIRARSENNGEEEEEENDSLNQENNNPPADNNVANAA